MDEYIENSAKEIQPKLEEIRAAIKKAAPHSIESISYGMPFYSFKRESGFKARLCYFGVSKNKKKITFYTRPMFLEEYLDEMKEYSSSKSALQFPLDRPIPLQLIQKIVRSGTRKHKIQQNE
ncbi:MAG: iron chaperone [Nitrososphaerales archaeon]